MHRYVSCIRWKGFMGIVGDRRRIFIPGFDNSIVSFPVCVCVLVLTALDFKEIIFAYFYCCCCCHIFRLHTQKPTLPHPLLCPPQHLFSV